MFAFLKGRNERGNRRQLDGFLQELQMNLSNNYKDAAQQNLKEFEAAFEKLKASDQLKEKQLVYYESRLSEYQAKLKNFTHKDQKPFWT